MPGRWRLLLGGFYIIIVAVQPVLAAQPPLVRQDIWYSVYVQGVHSGYSHLTTTPEPYHGISAIREDSTSVTQVIMLGTVVHQDMESQSWSDSMTGALLYQTFTMNSGGTETDITATFSTTSIIATLKSGTDTTTKTIAIPTGKKIVDGNSEGMSAVGPLTLGQTETDLEFDPLTLSLEQEVSTVVAIGMPVKDALDEANALVSKISVVGPEGNATAYQNSSGVPIRILTTMGISLVRCKQVDAFATNDDLASYSTDPGSTTANSSSPYQPSLDLAVNTSVSPVGQSLGDERTLTQLTVKLTVPGKPSKTITEDSVQVPPTATDDINTLYSPSTARYLANAPYLSLDNPEIKYTASQIVGTQTNAYRVVQAIHDWVYGHMSPDGSLGVPRSASDIILHQVGVCRDYAILYTSLARVSGIPTKVDVGLVGYKGKFYYHAWASSYVGGSVGWLQVDATLPNMFVDASHIALGAGDPTVMFALADVIGNMHVETLKAMNSL